MNEGISPDSASFSPQKTEAVSKPWLFPAAGAFLCLTLGMASGFFAASGPTEWYQGLNKPPGNPPSWVFGPVWTVLYLLMGAAAGLMVNRRAIAALWAFAIQFVLNLMWTPVFFGAQHPDYALGIIVLMWATLFICISLARRVGSIAGWLLVPYLAWVSYATYLNAGIFVLNP